jgi:hypothetical protein
MLRESAVLSRATFMLSTSNTSTMIAVNKPEKDASLPLMPQAFTAIEFNPVARAMEPSFNLSTKSVSPI